jgi:hypothetical protein
MSSTEEIERIASLDWARFKRDHLRANKPVIVTGHRATREAAEKWNFDYVASRHLGHPVAVDSFPGSRYAPLKNQNPPLPQIQMGYQEYVKRIRHTNQRKTLYLAEQPLTGFAPEIIAEAAPPDFLNGKRTYPVIFMGIDTYSHAHYHPVRNEAVLMQMSGRKKFILIPAKDYRCWHPNPWLSWNMNWSGIPMNGDPSAILNGEHAYKAWVAQGNQHGHYPRAAEVEPIECVIEAGELLFIPQGWFHIVYGIGENISVTHFFKGSARHAHFPLRLRDGVAWLLGTKHRT